MGDETMNYEKMKEKVTEDLKKHFRPEFLNRIDEVIVFHELTLEEIKAIVDLLMVRVQEQLAGQHLELILTDDAKEFLGNQGYDPELGARPLRRAIQRLLEDTLSERVLLGEFKAGSTILVGVDHDTNELTYESFDTPKPAVVEMAGQEGV
jgi:ATP-dependent Clp protease ATP-binding subunit ClpC